MPEVTPLSPQEVDALEQFYARSPLLEGNPVHDEIRRWIATVRDLERQRDEWRSADEHREAIEAERDELQRRLEQQQVQHAGCLTAAEGWAGKEPPQQGDWGWSPAFQAVLNLRNERDALERAVKRAGVTPTATKARIGKWHK